MSDCSAPLCANRAVDGDRWQAHPRDRRFTRATPPAAPIRRPPMTTAIRPTPAPPQQQPPTVDLISRGKGSTIARVRRAAEKAEAAMGALRDVLAETAQIERERAEADRLKAEAKAEIERLTEQLAAAKARLKPVGSTPTTTRAPSGPGQHPDYDTRTVRTWARANGIDCPNAGRFLPAAVVDAWRKATEA